MPPAAQIALMLGLLVALPATCAFVLRLAGAPGWPVLGGILAGVLLGPTILGRIAPHVHETIFVGGIEQREQLDRLLSRQGADLLAAEEAGFDPAAVEQLLQSHAQERAQLEAQLHDARWSHQQPMRIFAVIVIVVALLGASRHALPKPAEYSQHIVSPITIGLWAALLPGACAYLAANLWWGWPAGEAAIIAAAVMIGPWALTHIDREAADQAERGGAHLIQNAGRFATIIALVAAAWGFFALMGPTGLAWCAALGAIIVAWVFTTTSNSNEHSGMEIAEAQRRRGIQSEEEEANQAISTRSPLCLCASAVHSFCLRPRAVLISGFIIPSLAALAAIRIELFAHFAIWPILILIILSGDGRWLGAFIGAMTLGGRRGLRTMRLILAALACGPTQLAVVALAAHLLLLPHEAIYALVLGAAVIEATAPLRRSMARQLADAEEWDVE